jgi:hypothetical protein
MGEATRRTRHRRRSGTRVRYATRSHRVLIVAHAAREVKIRAARSAAWTNQVTRPCIDAIDPRDHGTESGGDSYRTNASLSCDLMLQRHSRSSECPAKQEATLKLDT